MPTVVKTLTHTHTNAFFHTWSSTLWSKGLSQHAIVYLSLHKELHASVVVFPHNVHFLWSQITVIQSNSDLSPFRGAMINAMSLTKSIEWKGRLLAWLITELDYNFWIHCFLSECRQNWQWTIIHLNMHFLWFWLILSVVLCLQSLQQGVIV